MQIYVMNLSENCIYKQWEVKVLPYWFSIIILYGINIMELK